MPVEKRNIFLHETRDTLPFVSKRRRSGTTFPVRTNPGAHAAFIAHELNECRRQDLTQRQVAAIRYKDGLYLEFSGAENCDLQTKALDNYQAKSGIRLLNVRQDGNVQRATVYIPAGKENYFLDRVQAFSDSLESLEEGKSPKHNDLVRSIEDVKLAVLESFWVGKREDMPGDVAVWCEVWLRYENGQMEEAISNFDECCSALEITKNPRFIAFPERVVRLVQADHNQLLGLLTGCDYLAEFRRAPEPTNFFDELNGSEQAEWVDELLGRTTFHNTGATVCILDTGLTVGHPLIAPATREDWVQSVDSAWMASDHDGHGTEMAGIAIYSDLKDALISGQPLNVYHQIEAVKLLPPRGENPPDLYGAITEQAVALAEIANPDAKRSHCIAVTSSVYNSGDGSPTSWSAAVDSVASGVADSDKRLVLVSAGNVESSEMSAVGYPDANMIHSVESPGQSWNALTVGAFSQSVIINDEAFSGFSPVAESGQLSPYSASSIMWASKWPVKPEILLDGGNIATNGADYVPCPDLSLLTTGHRPLNRKFSTIWATSSATAQASHMAAQLFAEYPDIWPETVRALLIHSARWTSQMKEQFCTDDSKKTGRRKLLRTCGYGIPNIDRAIQCLNNSVNLIIQGEIQPYEKDNGQIGMKEMHLHQIPWPTELLRSLGEAEVEMRVTLSYFIEPGPGEKGWNNRYRYPSCGLRFDVINTDESVEDFKKRINVKMREDSDDHGGGTSGSNRWYLGSENRDVGSVHSDFIKTSAVELCNANYLAVYPVVGWWRERSYLGKCNETVRYSLVVSISTPNAEIDLYTPIATQIPGLIETEIPTP